MKQILTFLLLFISIYAYSQHNLTGKVIDRTSGEPVEMATIRLFAYSRGDSTLVHGLQTDMDGRFAIANVRDGNYKLIVSSVGYYEYIQPVAVAGKDISLRTITLKEEVMHLAEVSVQGRAAEMTVKGDTIEYNTAAYKVNENAMVEDLLKKMNGVQVDQQGNVTVNGETITAVRIDGKKFFGNDVQSATKNIPAEMIEKIQVIDEKSETAKLTGFEDDDTEHIINLTLKADRKKGVFGKYTGGLGADMVTGNEGWFNYGDREYGAAASDRTKHFFDDDFRYNANIFTNLLLGESQTTILGSANNTNEIRMQRGRGNFGQDANAGITRSENLGVNTNIDLNNKITPKDAKTELLLGGDAAFSHSHNDTRSETKKESYTEDYTYLNADTAQQLSDIYDANVRLEMQYQIDSVNKIILQPRLSYTGQKKVGSEEYSNYQGDNLLSDGRQTTLDSTREISARLKMTYNHKFSRLGRSVTLTGNIEYTDNRGYQETYAFDRLSNSALVDQFTESNSGNASYYIHASYVEPIYKTNHLLEIAARFTGSNRNSLKNQYSADYSLSGDKVYEYDSLYSNQLNNNLYTERLELNYRWLTQRSDLTVGARVIASQTHSTTFYGGVLARDTLINTWNASPSVNFRYKFGKKEFARIRYRGRISQPTITQMEPVRNNSDAMNETVGNLSLRPAFQHRFMAMYSRFNQDRFSSVMTGIRGSLTQNALVGNTVYDETGKRYQQTVNADVIPWNISADLMYNTPFAQKMLQFNTRTMVSYNQRVAYTLRQQDAALIAQLIEENRLPLGDASFTGNLQVCEDLSLRFTHSFVDIGLRTNGTYSRTRNSTVANSTSNVFNCGVTGDVEFHLPKSWNIAADCGYTARYGYRLDNVNEIILNASLEKSWRNSTLSLQVYDILHQKKNIVQVISDNAVQYAKYNTLPTYFMLTFTYKLNKMGNLKASGMGGRMQEMIESGNQPGKPGGMPPMGPPPGM